MRPWRTISGSDPSGCAITGCAGGQRLDDGEPERLGEPDQVQQRQRAAQQLVALGRPDRAHVADARRSEVRLDQLPEVVRVLHDPRDDQRQPGSAGDLDGPVGALVGMDAAEEQQVAARAGRGT